MSLIVKQRPAANGSQLQNNCLGRYIIKYLILNAFKATLLPSSKGMILKMPSYSRKPIILHVGSIMPIIPVSDGRPMRSFNKRHFKNAKEQKDRELFSLS